MRVSVLRFDYNIRRCWVMTLNAAFMFSDSAGRAGIQEADRVPNPRRDRLLEAVGNVARE